MISDLESAKWLASRYGRLTPGTQFTGACVGPTGGLGTLEKVYIGSPYRKSNHEFSDVYLLLQSLYQLSYPVSRTIFSSCERQRSVLQNGNLRVLGRSVTKYTYCLKVLYVNETAGTVWVQD